ncbi:glycine cleavage system protein GcvH [Nannocystis sp.]|uniref:glycine cleavage system protein GcvH n=1 Tax=Nannocystis sp. TaxID=1962667 RepID=UPI0024222430|nr:glycine cleavage system protein GcvH [Nannocystis sp.]MBK7827805.1 glycine cleavage system protein GcvH [Nannocystis sp.]MBK9753845.1 glycine cleavage system protein GcvH [Nannocystis sp.]
MSESSIPNNLRYTKDHEWARAEANGTVTIGITTHAVDQLGDITMVSLPAVGASVTAGERFGDVDSVKAVSELFAPISGTVVAVNEHLNDSPEAVNAEPYGVGWMLKVRPSDPAALGDLLSAEQYIRHVAENG